MKDPTLSRRFLAPSQEVNSPERRFVRRTWAGCSVERECSLAWAVAVYCHPDRFPSDIIPGLTLEVSALGVIETVARQRLGGITITDCDGCVAIVKNTPGLTMITWPETGRNPSIRTVAWLLDDGRVFIPLDCQAPGEDYCENGAATGRWIEATTGAPAIVVDGAPRLVS